jgi:hypothetical protein
MMSSWYRRIFATRLAPHRQAVQEFLTTRQGYRLATSNGGVLTGRGADIILIDDPLKPEEALSDAQRQAANEWFSHTLYNIEGVGQVAQRELVRNALRMRPDRIIVGEVRGSEAFDMLQAMNTGHDGSMSTVHANTPRDALFRLENMVLMAAANLPLRALRVQIASAINLVVQIERMRDGIRRVERICEISGMEGEVVSTRDIFTFQYRGERDGRLEGTFESSRLRPDLAAKAAQYGLERQVLESVGITSLAITN